ncbi:MAG: hypothetical protein ACI8XC_000538 [Gammaproteobacteria bacterium]
MTIPGATIMANEYEFDDDFEYEYPDEDNDIERFHSSGKKNRNNVRNRIEYLMEKKRLRSMMDTSDSYYDDD